MASPPYSPGPSFHAAAEYVSTAPSLSKLPNDTKLKLYALFKIATTSSLKPNSSRPSIWDMTGRAKWDAWDRIGKSEVATAKEAEEKYIQTVRDLGWNEKEPLGSGSNLKDDAGTEERGEISGGGGGGGMGAGVSTMMAGADDMTDDEGTIHGTALSGDVAKLKLILDAAPGGKVDLDVLDEYGYTALHLASDRGKFEVVEELVQRGANLDVKDQDGNTALDLARDAEHSEILEYLQSRTR